MENDTGWLKILVPENGENFSIVFIIGLVLLVSPLDHHNYPVVRIEDDNKSTSSMELHHFGEEVGCVEGVLEVMLDDRSGLLELEGSEG